MTSGALVPRLMQIMRLKEMLLGFLKWSGLTFIKYLIALTGMFWLVKSNINTLYSIGPSVTETINIQLVLIGTTLAFASSLIGYSNVLQHEDKSRMIRKAETLLLLSIYQILSILFYWIELKSSPLTDNASLHTQVFLISTSFIVATLLAELFMVTGFIIRRLATTNIK